MLFDLLCFSLSGAFMKISDEAMDGKNNKILAIITGILCVIFTIMVSVKNGDAACIFLSILIGTALSSKVDSINHILSAVLFVIILLLLGFPNFGFVPLVVCSIAAFIDEKGNDIADQKEKNSEKWGLIDTLFKYRYALKIAVLIFSLIGLLNMYFPISSFIGGNYFEPLAIIYFYFFDLCYEFVASFFDRIYEIF